MAASRHLAAKPSGDRGHGERLAIVTRRRQESPSRRLFLEESTSNPPGSGPCGSASTPAHAGLRRWWAGDDSPGLQAVLQGHGGCSRWEVMLLSLKHKLGAPHLLGIPSPTAALYSPPLSARDCEQGWEWGWGCHCFPQSPLPPTRTEAHPAPPQFPQYQPHCCSPGH